MTIRYISTAVCLLFFSTAMAGTPEQPNGEDMLNGTVFDLDSKQPLKDVSITAIRESKKEKIVSTNCKGGFSFILLKPGTYKLIFEKEGYKKVVKERVEVKKKSPVKIEVAMPEFVPLSERVPSAWHFFES